MFSVMISVVKLSLFCFILYSCSPEAEFHYLKGRTMGTSYNIKIKNTRPISNTHADIKNLLKNINQIMSTYIADSEISKLNRALPNQWIPVSHDLFLVIDQAQKIAQVTKGAFDITVGPLVNLWGFGPTKTSIIPSNDAIKKLQSKIGFSKIMLDQKLHRIKKLNSSIYLDLSAIAKGYAVDQIADYLARQQFTDFMVEIGGEISVRGTKQWNIALASPQKNSFGKFNHILSLSNTAIATSGDYQNYFEQNGKRYSHTIDPRTGSPITHQLASVTVIHRSCMLADAYATALNVLGPKIAYKHAEKHGISVLFLVKSEQGFNEIKTTLMKKLLKE